VLFSVLQARDLEVGRSVTCSTLTFSSGGRMACGSGLHNVSVSGSKLSHTVDRCKRLQQVMVQPRNAAHIRAAAACSLIDMQGTRDLATASAARARGRAIFGSCIARPRGHNPGVHTGRTAGAHLARQFARMRFRSDPWALIGIRTPETFRIDQIRLGGKAHEMNRNVPRTGSWRRAANRKTRP